MQKHFPEQQMLLEKTGSLIFKKKCCIVTGERGPVMASLITSIASQHKAQTLILPLDIWIKPSSWGREKLPFCFAFLVLCFFPF